MIKKELIKSYAKINLSLSVLKKLKSKFHKIESLICFVDLYDEIYLNKTYINKIRLQAKLQSNINCVEEEKQNLYNFYRKQLWR